MIIFNYNIAWYWSTLMSISLFCLVIYAALTCHGMFLMRYGAKPFDKQKLIMEGGKVVQSTDGRLIEYFVWGSQKDDALPLILCHPSGATGKMMQWLYRKEVMEKLNLKAIAITYPGHGWSDPNNGRSISTWPRQDVVPVLDAEYVGRFIVQGYSYGTAHAMSCGVFFGPDRCLAIGLNCPFLPIDICTEFDMRCHGAILPRARDLSKWYNAFMFSLLELLWKPMVSRGCQFVPEFKACYKDNPAFFDMFKEDVERAANRGTTSLMFDEMTLDTTCVWGFHPADVQTQNICIWWANDDTSVPSIHGKCLADTFKKKDDINLNLKVSADGFGHFTYVRPKNIAEGIQSEVLLKMINERR